MKKILVVLCVLICGAVYAQNPGSGGVGGPTTVAKLPANAPKNKPYIVTDGASATDCSTGHGSTQVLCAWNGSAWEAVPSSVSGSSLTTQTNGVNNSDQTTLNVQNGTNTTASNPSAGNVQVNVATATSSVKGVVQGDGNTLPITAGVISCATSSAAQVGCAEPDNSTIKATAGVYAAQSTTINGVTCTPGGSCSVGSSNVTTCTGSASATAATCAGSPAPSSLTNITGIFTAGATSTGAPLTLNIASLGAKNVYLNGSATSTTNFVTNGQSYPFWYDGTEIQLLQPSTFPGTVSAAGFASGTSPPSLTAGTGGVLGAMKEGTAPSVGPASGVDVCYSDSTQVGILCNINNAGYLPMPQAPASTTDGAMVGFSGINGGALKAINGVPIVIANAGTTGTTTSTLTKLTGAPSTAVIAATTDTLGVVGITIAGAGTSSNATIQTSGLVSCVFDGATTAGDYVQISSSTGGDCHDTGASTYPTSGQVIGKVLSTNVGAGTYTIDLFSAGIQASSGGGVSSVTGDSTLFNNSASTGAVILNAVSQAPNTVFVGPLSTPGAANAAGTMQAAPYPLYFADPRSWSNIFDDFVCSSQNASNADGCLQWGPSIDSGGGVTGDTSATATTYGVNICTTGTVSGNGCGLSVNNGANAFIYNYHNISKGDLIYRASISATTTISFFAGFVNPNSGHGEGTTDYVGIAYDTTASDTNWMCVAKTAGTATRTSMGTAASTGYHDFRIRVVSQDHYACSVDNGTETTVSTNVPTGATETPQINVFTRTTAARAFNIDYFWQGLAISR